MARTGFMNALVLLCMGVFATILHGCANSDDGKGKDKPKDKPKWLESCHQRDDHETYDQLGCKTSERGDFPSVAKDAKFKVSYATHDLGAPGYEHFVQLFALKHSMVIIREDKPDSPVNIVIDYSAKELKKAVQPPVKTADGKLQWHNEAVVQWFPLDYSEKWPKNFNYTDYMKDCEIKEVGTVSGEVLGTWFEWIPTWGKAHVGYQYWSVWKNPADVSTGAPILEDNMCHTFAEDGLNKLAEKGAQFTQQEALCRNYLPFLTTVDDPPMMDMKDTSNAGKVVEFYGNIQKLMSCYATKSEGACMKAYEVFTTFNSHIYLFEHTATEKYYDVTLHDPYVGFTERTCIPNVTCFPTPSPYVYQRMKLSWQGHGAAAKLGECRRVAQKPVASVDGKAFDMHPSEHAAVAFARAANATIADKSVYV